MNVLGLDFETNSLDVEEALILEIGKAIWVPEEHRIVRQESTLLDHGIAELEPIITEETGITLSMLGDFGVEPEKGVKTLHTWMRQCDCVLAHNGNGYDRHVWRNTCKRLGIDPLEDKLWVDTMVDKIWPRKWNKQLTCLAAYHGFVNPFPHQALFDVATLIKLVSFYDWNQMVEMAKIPVIKIQALVSYEKNQLAKDRGFWWQKEDKRVTGRAGIWVKEIKECFLKDEMEAASFEVRLIG